MEVCSIFCSDLQIIEIVWFRIGPSGYKTLCNACGIRWRRTNGGSDLNSNVTEQNQEKKRKKKMNEVERLISDEQQDPIQSGKRIRTKRSLKKPNLSSKSDPVSVRSSMEQTDETMGDEDDLEERYSDNEEWSPSATPTINVQPPSPRSTSNPISIESIYNMPKYDCSASPFLFSGDIKIEKTIAKSPPKHAHQIPEPIRSPTNSNSDITLLREILQRLENLRKEHNKTTKQVERIMEECKTNPELFGDFDSRHAAGIGISSDKNPSQT